LAVLDSHITAVYVSTKQHWEGGEGAYGGKFETVMNMTFDPKVISTVLSKIVDPVVTGVVIKQ
jgi:hypothetical protein